MPGVMTLYLARWSASDHAGHDYSSFRMPETPCAVFFNRRPRLSRLSNPPFDGYSLGRWTDTDGGRRFDTLEVETRHLRGPRAYDPSGMPFHDDNETLLLKDADILIVESQSHAQTVTVSITHSAPWSVHKSYERNPKDTQRSGTRIFVPRNGIPLGS